MADCAATGASCSVPQSKHATRRCSGALTTALRVGLSSSCTRKYCPHCRQFVEIAARDSNCEWPQCGQTTCALSDFAGTPNVVRQAIGDYRPPALLRSGARFVSGGRSPARGAGAGVGAALFGFTSVLPTNVTPSSITSLADLMSPNSSAFALISILSFAVMFPLTLPRTTTELTL